MSEPIDEQILPAESENDTRLPSNGHVDGSESGDEHASEHDDGDSESDLDDDDLRALEIDNGAPVAAAANHHNDVSGAKHSIVLCMKLFLCA